jgi:formylglycine-generating enzyme required for sulfatase activity
MGQFPAMQWCRERRYGVLGLFAMVFCWELAGCRGEVRESSEPSEIGKFMSIQHAVAAQAPNIEFTVASVRFDLRRIAPGEFDLGSPVSEPGHLPNESPIRRVRISKAFYLSSHEITQAQYQAVTGTNPSSFRGETLPVDQISYRAALEFCDKLSKLAKAKITLPTEAQWEYACRAGTRTPFYSGSTASDLDKIAWYAGNARNTVHPVGLKLPNPWGLYDMIGNVWELCIDFLEPYDRIQAVDPAGTTRRGAMRGGGWMDEANYCRAASRMVNDDMFGGAGIRIAVNPE